MASHSLTFANLIGNIDETGSADNESNHLGAKKPEEHGIYVILASEPSTYDPNEWDLIEQNHCLMFEKIGKAQLEKPEYPAECNDIRNYLPH